MDCTLAPWAGSGEACIHANRCPLKSLTGGSYASSWAVDCGHASGSTGQTIPLAGARGEKAVIVPKGFPARRNLWQRIERTRLLELEEGVREPVVYEEPSERDRRRQERALALHEAEVKSRAEAEAEVDVQAEAETDAEAGAEAEVEEVEVGAEAEAEVEAEVEAEAEAETVAVVEAEAAAAAEAEAEAEAEAKAKAMAMTMAMVEAAAEVDKATPQPHSCACCACTAAGRRERYFASGWTGCTGGAGAGWPSLLSRTARTSSSCPETRLRPGAG